MKVPRRTHGLINTTPAIVLATVRSGVENNKTAAAITRELAEMGYPVPERTVGRWATAIHAERFRRLAVDTLPSLVSQGHQAGGWQLDELLETVNGLDLADGWWARSARDSRRLLERYLNNPSPEAKRTLDAALLKHVLASAVRQLRSHQREADMPSQKGQELFQ